MRRVTEAPEPIRHRSHRAWLSAFRPATMSEREINRLSIFKFGPLVAMLYAVAMPATFQARINYFARIGGGNLAPLVEHPINGKSRRRREFLLPFFDGGHYLRER